MHAGVAALAAFDATSFAGWSASRSVLQEIAWTVDDLPESQAVLFQTDEKRARMTAFLERRKS